MHCGKKLLLLGTVVVLLSVPSIAGVRFGGMVVGFGYTHFSGPYCCYPYYYDRWYGPYGYGAWYPPAWFSQASPRKGTVKLRNVAKNAEIYIDQAYAGKAGELKDIHLDPGAYDLEVRAPGSEPVQKRVYVLSGKTVKLEF